MLKNRVAGLLLAMAVTVSGVALAQDDHRDHDRDERAHQREQIPAAHDIGFNDGSRVAREDLARHKPFYPHPRGKYAHMDHGYRPEYGPRDAYMRQYGRAYQEGYERTYRGH